MRRTGRKTEDDLAYFRGEHEFRSVELFEQPNGDFAVTIARQFVVSYYQFELYRRLTESTDATLAAIAAKAVKEVDYHRDHSAQWVLRLALGTDESRAQDDPRPSSTIWPYVDELFRDDELTARLAAAGAAVEPSSLRADFDRLTGEVLAEAELEVPQVPAARGGGRNGQALRAPRLPPGRDAGAGPRAPRSELVGADMVVIDPTADTAPDPRSRLPSRRPGTSPPPCAIRRSPSSPSRTWASCGTSGEVDDGGEWSRGPRHHHAHVLGLPGHGRHPG